MKIGIVGAGTMGRGIAEAALRSGHTVIITDPITEARAFAGSWIEQNLRRSINKGHLAGPLETYLSRLRLESELPADGDMQWVIEAAPEQIALKQSIFVELDVGFGPAVWLASNTSSIAISKLKARVQRHPDRVGGLHFFNPVPRMGLVEIIRGMDTSDEYIAAAKDLVASLSKTSIVVPDRPGFLVNRVARPYYLEALRMVDEGVVSLEVVDQVMEGAGFRMGPFGVMDLVGVDVNFSVTESVYQQTFYDERYRPHRLQQQFVERGFLGQKTGRGFYRYDG